MCLVKLYENKDSKQAVLTDIAYIRWNSDGVELETLFGEKRAIQGAISSIDFIKSRLILVDSPQ
ncbi:MAG: CooT family nickel-binding protein [Chloroflexota bacterium]